MKIIQVIKTDGIDWHFLGDDGKLYIKKTVEEKLKSMTEQSKNGGLGLNWYTKKTFLEEVPMESIEVFSRDKDDIPW